MNENTENTEVVETTESAIVHKVLPTESMHHDVRKVEILHLKEFEALSNAQKRDILHQFSMTILVAHNLNSFAKNNAQKEKPVKLTEVKNMRWILSKDGNTVRYNKSYNPTVGKASKVQTAIEAAIKNLETAGVEITESLRKSVSDSIRSAMK